MKFEATREVSFLRVLGRPYAVVLRQMFWRISLLFIR